LAPIFIEGITAPDPSYNVIRDHGNRSYLLRARKLTESLWERYERHADENFLTAIQLDFQARFWEMYLACTMEELGFVIECHKPGPDIFLTHNGTRVWIEAVAPSGGEKGHPDRVPQYQTGSLGEDAGAGTPDKQIVLRYRSAIAEKLRKYAGYLEKGPVLANDAYVIAINGSKINYAVMDSLVPRIVQAAYPVEHLQVRFAIDTNAEVDRSLTYRNAISKASGQSISTDIFLSGEYRPVSALLFSCVNAVDSYCMAGEDYVLVHNVRAAIPISERLIGRGREFSVSEIDGNCSLKVKEWTRVDGAQEL
jgi:hypothetical protein